MFPQLVTVRRRRRHEAVDDPEAGQGLEDEYVSKLEAATILGVHERTIYRYLRAGKLRVFPHGRLRGVRRSDIRELQMDRDDPLPFAINHRLFAQIRAELHIARMELEQCKELLDMKRRPLELTAQQLVDRHVLAQTHVARGCPAAFVPEWVDFLVRLRDKNLESIEFQSCEPHPWVSFLRLAAMLQPTVDQLIREPSLTRYLAAAREHMDVLAYIWIVKRYGEAVMQRIVKDLVRQRTP